MARTLYAIYATVVIVIMGAISFNTSADNDDGSGSSGSGRGSSSGYHK